MLDKDVRTGMKVVPFQKTKVICDSFSSSNTMRRIKETGQEYTYVLGWDMEESCWLLSDKKGARVDEGDFFNASDFEPYVEEEKSIRRLTNPITIRQSENMGYIVEYQPSVGQIYTCTSFDEMINKLRELYTA